MDVVMGVSSSSYKNLGSADVDWTIEPRPFLTQNAIWTFCLPHSDRRVDVSTFKMGDYPRTCPSGQSPFTSLINNCLMPDQQLNAFNNVIRTKATLAGGGLLNQSQLSLWKSSPADSYDLAVGPRVAAKCIWPVCQSKHDCVLHGL